MDPSRETPAKRTGCVAPPMHSMNRRLNRRVSRTCPHAPPVSQLRVQDGTPACQADIPSSFASDVVDLSAPCFQYACAQVSVRCRCGLKGQSQQAPTRGWCSQAVEGRAAARGHTADAPPRS